MAKKKAKKVGHARPGSTVIRRVKSGPGKGDLVEFRANSAGSAEPGKLKPRRVVKDVPPLRTQSTLAHGKKKTKKRTKHG